MLGVATQVEAQTIISAARRIDWTQAGIAGGVPNRATICATLNPGATFTQINSAIAACNNGVVFLNAGTYNLAGGIVFNNKSNVTLRGAGPDQTFLKFTNGNSCGGLGGDLCIINGDPGLRRLRQSEQRGELDGGVRAGRRCRSRSAR